MHHMQMPCCHTIQQQCDDDYRENHAPEDNDDGPKMVYADSTVIGLQLTTNRRYFSDGVCAESRDTSIIYSNNVDPLHVDYEHLAQEIIREVPRHFQNL